MRFERRQTSNAVGRTRLYCPARGIMWAAVLALALGLQAAAFALPVAHLHRVKAGVEIRTGGAPQWAAAHERSALDFGDFVRTGKQGKADLLFTNGTQVALRENTTIQIVRVTQPEKPLAVRLWGALSEIFVRPKGNTQIETAAAIAAARGTEYSVKLLSDNVTEVTVYEGSVESSNQFGAVLINAGQRSVATTTSAPTPPVAVDVTGLLTWTADISGLPLEIERPFGGTDPAALKAALATRRAAVAANGSDARAHFDLAQVFYDLGLYGESVAEFTAGTRLAPQDAAGQRGLARALLGQGDAAGAAKALAAARALDPTNPINNAEEGLALLAAGDEAGAVKALQAGAPTALSQTALGIVALRHDRNDEAATALQAAVNSDAQFYQAQSLLALAYLNAGQLDKAEAAARAAVQQQPNSGQAQGTLGLVLFFRGQAAEADKVAARAVALDPFSSMAHLTRGRVLLAQQKNAAARGHLEQARALAPALLPVHIDLGNVYLRLAMPQKAEHEFRLVLEKDPNSVAAQTGLGNALKAQGRVPEAIAAYEAALKINKNDAGALGGLGQLYIQEGRIKDAQELIGSVTGDRAEHGALLIQLAEASLLQQDLNTAQYYARNAVRLLPGSAVAHYELGRVYLEQGRLVQAEQEFRQAVTIDRQFTEARYALGFVRERAESGFNPARPLARVGAYNLGSATGALDIQNLQSPGADERVKAAISDPSVVRRASRAYGDIELEGALGSDNTNDFRIAHLYTTRDHTWTQGASAERHETDGPITNSDSTTDRYGVIVGQRFEESLSSILFLGSYQSVNSGGNTNNDPGTLNVRERTRQPQFLLGGNLQKNDRSSTRGLVQYMRPAQSANGIIFGGSNTAEIDSLNGELRHDIYMARHIFTLGGGAGTRIQDADLFNGPIPGIAPASEFLSTAKSRSYDFYVRDEWAASGKLRLIGELNWHRSKLVNSFTSVQPLALPPIVRTVDNKTRLVPTFIASYSLSPRSALRLRARRLAGTIRDFELLRPTEVFLFNYDDLAHPALTGGRGSSYELEFDRTFGSASFLRIGLVHQSLTNVRVPSLNGSGAALQKVTNKSLRIGYEGMVTGNTSFFLNTNFNRSNDDVRGRRVALTPRFSAEAGLHFLNRTGWFLQPSIFYQGSQIDTNAARTTIPAYSVSNLRVGKRWGLRTMVFAEVLNAFDKNYQAFDIIQPGRQFRVGFDQRF